jgi:hypothetical protein
MDLLPLDGNGPEDAVCDSLPETSLSISADCPSVV